MGFEGYHFYLIIISIEWLLKIGKLFTFEKRTK